MFIKTVLKVTGLADAINFFENRNKQLNELDSILEDIIRDTISLMMRYAAVDTGEMMESIRYEKNKRLSYTIYISSPHAWFNEYGTKYMSIGTTENPLGVVSTSGKYAYRPFIRPALWQMSQTFPEYFSKIKLTIKVGKP